MAPRLLPEPHIGAAGGYTEVQNEYSVVHGKILEVQVHGDAWRHIEVDKGEEVSVRHDEAEHQRIAL